MTRFTLTVASILSIAAPKRSGCTPTWISLHPRSRRKMRRRPGWGLPAEPTGIRRSHTYILSPCYALGRAIGRALLGSGTLHLTIDPIHHLLLSAFIVTQSPTKITRQLTLPRVLATSVASGGLVFSSDSCALFVALY